MRFVLPAALFSCLLCGSPAWGTTATFRYEAFVGAARAGVVVIEVETTPERYAVRGRAESKGLLEKFSNWRARFSVAGIFGKKRPEAERYYLFQRDDDKKREVTIEDGQLKYMKNGKMRRQRAAPLGADVLTALFIEPDCQDQLNVHTGRHEYRMDRYEGYPDVCRYRVVDDDGDEFDAEIRFAEREGMTVPVRIEVGGLVSGRMQLVGSQGVAAGASD